MTHPDGTTGRVLYLPAPGRELHKAWRVDYMDGTTPSSLGLQIGPKGQGVVMSESTKS